MQNQISHNKLIGMILIGSILETYDYMLYGYFASIIAKQFFPTFDATSSLLLTFTVFSVGFITRPLGAAIFGNFGDKYGRKQNLLISIMLMAIPTTLIGILPTYAQIGLTAAILLACCRLLQGLAVGAEFAGTMVYMIELAPSHKRTFYGSLCICSGYIAMLGTATLVTLLTTFLSPATLAGWGWRIPFLMGFLLGLIGLYIRAQLPETPPFRNLVKSGAVAFNPFLQIITEMPLALVKGIGVVLLHAAGFYLLFVYLTSFLSTFYKIPTESISLANSIALIIAVITLPLFGLLGERINKQTLVILSSTSIIILSYPLFNLLSHPHFLSILMVQAVLTVLLCLTSSVLPALLAEMFPVSLRYSGVALSYNVASVVFGGTAPLVLTFLVGKTQSPAAPGIYLMCAAFITLVSILLVKSNAGVAIGIQGNQPNLLKAAKPNA